MRYNELIVENNDDSDDELFGTAIPSTLAQSFEFPEDGDLGYAMGGGGITYGNGHQTEGLVIISRSGQSIAFIPDFTYFDGEPTQEDLEELFYDDDPEYGTHREPLTLANVQKYLSLNEADDDAEMFGQSDKTIKKIQIANFQAHLPEFQLALKGYTVAAAGPTAREITKELGQVYRYFRGSEEVADLAYDMITQELPGYLTSVVQWVAQDPTRADDEDEMYDYLSNLCEDIRHKSELWIYITEILEELADGPGEGMDEYEFDLAMVISGELTQMITNGIQQSFAKVNKLQDSLLMVNEGTAGGNDYQQLVNFINANKTPGVPPEQQVALGLFRELKKTQQHNQELDAELAAAEQRIDMATQGGEVATRELGKHRAELDRERDAMSKLDRQYAERTKASQDQISGLTYKLEQIKTKPGVSKGEVENLEKQIQQLTKNGIDADKVKEIERNIAVVQNMQHVDDSTIKNLVAQINAAQAKAAQIDQTKKELGSELEKSAQDAHNEVEQLKKQIAQVSGLGQQMKQLKTELTDLEAEYEETDQAVYDLEHMVRDINDSLSAKSMADAAANQIRQSPEQAAKAHTSNAIAKAQGKKPESGPRVDPRLYQSLISKGVLKPEPDKKVNQTEPTSVNQTEPQIQENKFFAAVKWATKK